MCGELISPLYPALEAGATLLGFVFLFTQGLTFTFMMSLLALPFLLALFVLSWDTQKSDETLPLRIPGVLLALALMLGGGQALLSTHPAMVILDKLIGGAGFAAVGLMLARTRRGLFRERLASPSGEIGLLAVAGLWLGVSSLPVFLIGAGFYGAVAAAIRMAVHGAKPRPGQSVMLHAFIASFMVTMAFGARILALLIS